MNLQTLFIGISAFLMVVILLMIIGFIVREITLSRQLEAIREAMTTSSETSSQIVSLVDSALSVVKQNRESDQRCSDETSAKIKDINQLLTMTILPVLTRLDALMNNNKNPINFNAYNASGAHQVNQGDVNNPNNR